MPTLHELQHGLAARIVAGEGPELDAWVRVPAGADPAARIAVYTEGYPARLAEALRESFPALANILGDGSLAGLCERYRVELPVAPVNLNDIGRCLPAFLERDPLTERLAFLPDLAALEWAVTRAFHAEVAAAFDPAACAAWSLDDWRTARIVFQPGLRLLRSRWPLCALHATRHQQRSDIDLDLEQGGDNALVFRRGYDVAVEAVDDREADALAAFEAGANLGEVSAELARGEAAEDAVVGLFAGWVASGLIASVRGDA